DNEVCLTLTWQPARDTLSFSYQRLRGEERLPASSGKIRLCQ
ncbi:hydroxymyristoyl-ACP dehydratase, partial [Escherichia coli]|nr:hydroxymyristoyl-ACP dehydratase [Escherichia coli]